MWDIKHSLHTFKITFNPYVGEKVHTVEDKSMATPYGKMIFSKYLSNYSSKSNEILYEYTFKHLKHSCKFSGLIATPSWFYEVSKKKKKIGVAIFLSFWRYI